MAKTPDIFHELDALHVRMMAMVKESAPYVPKKGEK